MGNYGRCDSRLLDIEDSSKGVTAGLVLVGCSFFNILIWLEYSVFIFCAWCYSSWLISDRPLEALAVGGATFAYLNINHFLFFLFPICRRWHISQGLVRSFIVVVVRPLVRYITDISYGSEYVSIKYRSPVGAIEAFYVTVLGRTSGLDEQQFYVISCAPFPELLCDELRAIVTTYVSWLTVQPNGFLKSFYHPFRRKGHWHLLCYRNSVTVIYYIQYPELPAKFFRNNCGYIYSKVSFILFLL